MKSRFDFNSVSEITGAFVILAVITLTVLLTMTARVQRWFDPVYHLTVTLPPENQLPAGAEALRDAEVFIAATPVGIVENVRSDEVNGNVVSTATLSLQGDAVKELYADAAASVSVPFLPFLGEPSIKLSKGTPGEARLFVDGLKTATLGKAAKSDKDIQKELEKWNNELDKWNKLALKWEGKADKWEGYFDEWNVIAHNWEERMAALYVKLDVELTEPNGRLILFMDNLNLLLDRLANEGLVAWAVRDPEWDKTTQELMTTVQTGANDAVEMLELLNSILDGGRELPPPFAETAAELPAMAQRVNELLDRTDKVLAQVELASASLPAMANSVEKDMRTLPGFLVESQETLRQVEIMVRALQRHWLLRDYVDPRPSKGRIPVDEVVGPLGGDDQ